MEEELKEEEEEEEIISTIWTLFRDVLPRVCFENDLLNFSKAVPLLQPSIQRRLQKYSALQEIPAIPKDKMILPTTRMVVGYKVNITDRSEAIKKTFELFDPENIMVTSRTHPSYKGFDEVLLHSIPECDIQRLSPLRITVSTVSDPNYVPNLEFFLPCGHDYDVGSVTIRHPKELPPTAVNFCFLYGGGLKLPGRLEQVSSCETRAVFSEFPVILSQDVCYNTRCLVCLTWAPMDGKIDSMKCHVDVNPLNYSVVLCKYPQHTIIDNSMDRFILFKFGQVVRVLMIKSGYVCSTFLLNYNTDYFCLPNALPSGVRCSVKEFKTWIEKNGLYTAYFI